MINNRKASYILQELKNISLYQEIFKEHQNEYEMIQKEKETFASPKSPQGHENIGAGNQHNAEDGKERLLNLLEKQDDIEYKMDLIKQRVGIALQYKLALMDCEDYQFVKDYLDGMKIRDIEKKHNVSNAYDKMIRLIRNNIDNLLI